MALAKRPAVWGPWEKWEQREPSLSKRSSSAIRSTPELLKTYVDHLTPSGVFNLIARPRH